MTGPEPFTHPTQLTSHVSNCGYRQSPSVQLYVNEPLPAHQSQELSTPLPLPYSGAGSSAGSSGRLSMKELTEKTARPGPGSPYPGGDLRPKSSIVAR